MIQFLIERPIAVLMTTIAFLVMGLAASNLIPTSLMPEIPVPEITVQLSYPGSTARELETNVVRPLRNQLLQVSKLKDIHSFTQDGFATLSLQLEFGANTDLAFIETNEKLDAALNLLPRDLERPKVIKASATDIPVVNLMVSLKEKFSEERFLELSEFAESVLKKRIEQLPDIALADVSGLSRPELVVIPDQEKLQSLGIGSTILVEAIRQNNFEFGNLSIQNGIYQYNFKLANPPRSKRDIESIFLNIDGRLLQLKELASIRLLPRQERGLVFANGKRSVVLAIIKQADAKVHQLNRSLEETTKAFAEEYPELDFSTNQDQTELLRFSIENLKSSLWIGSMLAILIMFFFLNDIKSPLIIAISIPVSLVISLFFMYVLGMSINIISLSGLILGVGMMIDNSIIVIDNITQKLESNYSIGQACVEGTNEIISPLISSVLTTCSVFFPLLFLSGITGALFLDQAMAVGIGLGTSLIVSIFLIPVIFKQLKDTNLPFEKGLLSNISVNGMEQWYERGYHFFFRRKGILFGIAIGSSALGIYFFYALPYSQLPVIEQNEAVLELDWNENITLQENRQRIEQLLEQFPELTSVYAKIGEQQFLLQKENSKSFSEASVYLKTERAEAMASLQGQLGAMLEQNYPQATFSLEPPKNLFQQLFGTPSGNVPLQAKVFSREGQELPSEQHLSELKALLGSFSTSAVVLKQSALIQIIHERVLIYEVIYQDLLNELKNICNQHFIDNLKSTQQFIPISLAYRPRDFEEMINEAFVKNRRGEWIALRELIRIYPVQQYKIIQADRGGEFLPFQVDARSKEASVISALQETFLAQKQFSIRFGGSYFDLQRLKGELLLVMGISVLLLYLIMAAQFESLWQPLIILLEIPIDLGGALLLLWLFGGTINLMAAIGMVVMSGVIINDSILKLHTINLHRKEGLSIEQAIKLSGKQRLKPILMTSLTTILALLPFLFMGGLGAELQQPLALTIIGGMLMGTFISLYFIPVLYYQLGKDKK